MSEWVVQARASYDGSPTGQLPIYEAAKLGGFLNLSAFASGQLVGDDATYGSLRIERILGTLPLGLRGDMFSHFLDMDAVDPMFRPAAKTGRPGTSMPRG